MPAPWYLPEDRFRAADCLENLAWIISFFSTLLIREKPDQPLTLNDTDQAGLDLMLIFCIDCLNRCQFLIRKEAKHENR